MDVVENLIALVARNKGLVFFIFNTPNDMSILKYNLNSDGWKLNKQTNKNKHFDFHSSLRI